jgi:hypothetical protein
LGIEISAVFTLTGMGSDLILYQFSQSKVEHGDSRHFLDKYAPDRLSTVKSSRGW